MLHSSLFLTFFFSIHIKFHQILFQECWSIPAIHKLLEPTPAIFSTNLKLHTNFSFNPYLATPANITISTIFQLMKANVLAESSSFYFFFISIDIPLWSTGLSQDGATSFAPYFFISLNLINGHTHKAKIHHPYIEGLSVLINSMMAQ